MPQFMNATPMSSESPKAYDPAQPVLLLWFRAIRSAPQHNSCLIRTQCSVYCFKKHFPENVLFIQEQDSVNCLRVKEHSFSTKLTIQNYE